MKNLGNKGLIIVLLVLYMSVGCLSEPVRLNWVEPKDLREDSLNGDVSTASTSVSDTDTAQDSTRNPDSERPSNDTGRTPKKPKPKAEDNASSHLLSAILLITACVALQVTITLRLPYF